MEIKTPPKIQAYAHHICRAWYNGSYTCTMAPKPIKFLESQDTMTQFLINIQSDLYLTATLGTLKSGRLTEVQYKLERKGILLPLYSKML